MKYYRVKNEYDNTRKFRYVNREKTHIKNDDILIAGELYTQKEREKLYNDDKCFEVVEIPKNKIYFFFGARFSINDDNVLLNNAIRGF